MNKLFCLLGESCSGKDTIFKEVLKLAQQENLNIKPLISNTSRPRRDSEKQGVDYNFVSMHQFDADYKNEKVAEYFTVKIEKINEIWVYYTNKNDIDLEKSNFIKIISPSGLSQLKSQYNDNIVSIWVSCPKEIRRERYIKRNAILDSVDDRFLRDEIDFKNLITDYKVINDGNSTIDEVSNEIFAIIKKEIL